MHPLRTARNGFDGENLDAADIAGLSRRRKSNSAEKCVDYVIIFSRLCRGRVGRKWGELNKYVTSSAAPNMTNTLMAVARSK